jgi:hypothetical protein
MKILMVIVKILFVGALVILGNYNLHLGDVDERHEFYTLYGDWTKQIFGQTLVTTGYVVKFEWLPELPENSGNDVG